MRYSLLLPLVLASFSWGSAARAEERYYVIMFGSQSMSGLPRSRFQPATCGETQNQQAGPAVNNFAFSNRSIHSR